jgi:hypothetical protein
VAFVLQGGKEKLLPLQMKKFGEFREKELEKKRRLG